MVLKTLYKWASFSRMKQIELMASYAMDFQIEQLSYLVSQGKNTSYGALYGLMNVKNYEDFKKNIPVVHYNDIKHYIKRMLEGEESVLWPGKVKWFAKSSGTTADKSKFIPVSEESLKNTHYKGGKDIFAIYVNNYPDTKIFSGKALSIGGAHQINPISNESFYGDLSAILIQNLPFWANFLRVPSLQTALLDDWGEKIKRIIEESKDENVTTVAGIPSWTFVVFNHLLDATGKKNILEVWPQFELFVHGGVSFDPYKNAYKKLLPSDSVKYLETYNASEGFFAIQVDKGSNDMMLMLDYQVFYEFIPFDEYEKNNFSNAVPIEGVKKDIVYVMVITTNGGLWRYIIGDTVKFTSINPYKIKIVGRIKHYINVFGEELMIDQVEKAIAVANEKTGAIVVDYTVGPVFMDYVNKKGAHEWVIEFEKSPGNLDYYASVLDNELQKLNSDYEAKRKNNFTLHPPKINVVSSGTFHKWLSQKGKLGGQHKMPRLSNNREILEEILSIN